MKNNTKPTSGNKSTTPERESMVLSEIERLSPSITENEMSSANSLSAIFLHDISSPSYEEPFPGFDDLAYTLGLFPLPGEGVSNDEDGKSNSSHSTEYQTAPSATSSSKSSEPDHKSFFDSFSFESDDRSSRGIGQAGVAQTAIASLKPRLIDAAKPVALDLYHEALTETSCQTSRSIPSQKHGKYNKVLGIDKTADGTEPLEKIKKLGGSLCSHPPDKFADGTKNCNRPLGLEKKDCLGKPSIVPTISPVIEGVPISGSQSSSSPLSIKEHCEGWTQEQNSKFSPNSSTTNQSIIEVPPPALRRNALETLPSPMGGFGAIRGVKKLRFDLRNDPPPSNSPKQPVQEVVEEIPVQRPQSAPPMPFRRANIPMINFGPFRTRNRGAEKSKMTNRKITLRPVDLKEINISLANGLNGPGMVQVATGQYGPTKGWILEDIAIASYPPGEENMIHEIGIAKGGMDVYDVDRSNQEVESVANDSVPLNEPASTDKSDWPLKDQQDWPLKSQMDWPLRPANLDEGQPTERPQKQGLVCNEQNTRKKLADGPITVPKNQGKNKPHDKQEQKSEVHRTHLERQRRAQKRNKKENKELYQKSNALKSRSKEKPLENSKEIQHKVFYSQAPKLDPKQDLEKMDDLPKPMKRTIPENLNLTMSIAGRPRKTQQITVTIGNPATFDDEQLFLQLRAEYQHLLGMKELLLSARRLVGIKTETKVTFRGTTTLEGNEGMLLRMFKNPSLGKGRKSYLSLIRAHQKHNQTTDSLTKLPQISQPQPIVLGSKADGFISRLALDPRIFTEKNSSTASNPSELVQEKPKPGTTDGLNNKNASNESVSTTCSCKKPSADQFVTLSFQHSFRPYLLSITALSILLISIFACLILVFCGHTSSSTSSASTSTTNTTTSNPEQQINSTSSNGMIAGNLGGQTNQQYSADWKERAQHRITAGLVLGVILFLIGIGIEATWIWLSWFVR